MKETYHDSAAFVDSLIKNFGEEIEGKRKFLTPGTQRLKIQRSTVNMDDLDTQSSKEIKIWSQHVIVLDKIFLTRNQ
jgi:hypothetical protein